MALTSKNPQQGQKRAYWSASLRAVLVILSIWFLLSLGCGVVFRRALDQRMPLVGGAPFGFWMAQQGAVLGFVVLLVAYMVWMNRLDNKYGFDEESGDRGQDQ